MKPSQDDLLAVSDVSGNEISDLLLTQYQLYANFKQAKQDPAFGDATKPGMMDFVVSRAHLSTLSIFTRHHRIDF